MSDDKRIGMGYRHAADMFRRLFSLPIETFVAFAIIAYFSGWHYVNSYFSMFGINRSSISFDNYTVFLYSFYVLAEIPSMLVTFKTDARWAFATLIAMLFASAIDFSPLHRPIVHFFQRIVVVVLGISSLFFFSVAAGTSDAEQVLYQKMARPVTITFTEKLKKSWETQYDAAYADVAWREFREAGRLGAFALIWRNSDETVILQYETAAGEGHGAPVAVHRIPNQFIAVVEPKLMEKQ